MFLTTTEMLPDCRSANDYLYPDSEVTAVTTFSQILGLSVLHPCMCCVGGYGLLLPREGSVELYSLSVCKCVFGNHTTLELSSFYAVHTLTCCTP